MKKTIYVCDQCKMETSNPGKVIGWVSWQAKDSYLQIRCENTSAPDLGCAIRFVQFPSNLEFCSLGCFVSYIQNKVYK